MISRNRVAAAVIAAAMSTSAGAGVEWKAKSADGDGKTTERTIQISGKMMRVDEPQQSTILRLDKGLMWNVDARANTYRELTFAEMGAAMDEMKKTLADLPPEQRAMVEKMMGAKGAELQVKVTATGEAKVVGEHKCSVYTMDVGPLHATFCAAKDLKPSAELKAFYEALGETVGKTPGLEAFRAQADAYKQVDGFPVEEVTVVSTPLGERRQTYTFVSYATKDIPASAFELPSGVKKVEMSIPKLGGRGK